VRVVFTDAEGLDRFKEMVDLVRLEIQEQSLDELSAVNTVVLLHDVEQDGNKHCGETAVPTDESEVVGFQPFDGDLADNAIGFIGVLIEKGDNGCLRCASGSVGFRIVRKVNVHVHEPTG